MYNNALPENLGKRAEVKKEFDAHKVPENLRKLAEDKSDDGGGGGRRRRGEG
ncbi:MAG: hypothetical protein KAU14_03810 [Thermoplasmata archaeon]|nr:hypothetical protein [Thermoplasmata archaeon]